MPAKLGKEQYLLRRFIRVYEQDSWADSALDWVDERLDGGVELIATRKADGATLAIEHTVIQPYPFEKEDFSRFERAFNPARPDDSLVDQGLIISVNVPGGTLRPGDDWNSIAEAVRSWIPGNKHRFDNQESLFPCALPDGRTIDIQASAIPTEVGKGLTTIRRYGPFDVAATVRGALQTKLPKLTGAGARKAVLMFERDQFMLNHGIIMDELERQRPNFPLLSGVDEIWIAETHEDRRLVLFDIVRPDRRYAPVYTFIGDHLQFRTDDKPELPHLHAGH